MGIHDRDYYRESTRGMFDAWGRRGVTIWLIGITTVAFFAQCVGGAPNVSPLLNLGDYDPAKIARGEVWRLLTPLFLHLDLPHLFFNMLLLYFVGTRMEEVYGRAEFVVFYLVAGVFASLLYFVCHQTGLQPPTRAIGASGAVTAALVLFAFHYPNKEVLLFFVLPMPVWLLVVIAISLDTLGVMGFQRDQVAYAVHLGGALFGFLYYQSGRRFTAAFKRSPGAVRRRQPVLRVVPAEPPEETPDPVPALVEPRRDDAGSDEPFEVKVDRVLAKVSQLGQSSLTEEERRILFRAGEVYKRRRK